ncbi:MAG TPA: hypothetical protein VEH57_03445 [Thermoplasmata archaeon]|nr:hypothetical protein [Thermoplasmata archaeon]
MLRVNSTNVTVQFTLSTNATVYLFFNYTANFLYGFTQLSDVRYTNSQLKQNVFIDYLEPNTTYHYEITASTYCMNPGSSTGSWQTGSDGPYMASSGSYIFGTVYNATGAPHAVAGVMVVATCAVPYTYNPFSTTNPWYSYTTTNSLGQYWIYVPPTHSINPPGQVVDICQAGEPGGGASAGYVVCVDNYGTATPLTKTCLPQSNDNVPAGQVWTGHWNETVTTWAPQVVNFQLPQNLETPPLVQIADFSNANTSNGWPNSNMTYMIGTTTTTYSAHCWEVLFFIHGCTAAQSISGSGVGYPVTGQNLVVTQQMWESGTVIFNMESRQFNITTEDYVGDDGYPVNEPSTWKIADTLNPSNAQGNSSIYLLWAWGAQYQQGRRIYTPGVIGWFTATSSQVSYDVKGFDISLGAELPGVTVATTVVSEQWSQMSTTTVTESLYWEARGNSATIPVCYVVYGVGGSSSSSSTTADAIGIWAYSPTYSGGSYSCPLPT